MDENRQCEWGLYGGAGFIGQHLAYSILNSHPDHQVTLLDLRGPGAFKWIAPLEKYVAAGRLHVHEADVREYEQLAGYPRKFDVIVNLAAILREPGHRREEYFETNVSGARNVCRVAEEMGCNEIIFTSTVAVYGIHDQTVDERSTPQPKMPYGQSKLEAEAIHRQWAEKTGGRLSIIRPGVVFGTGENGNATRLVREMLNRQRSIQIRPDQIKAGIYIEELIEICHWLRTRPPGPSGFHLVNAVSKEPLTFNAYGQTLDKMRHFSSKPFTVPESLLKLTAAMTTPLSWIFPSSSKFHPRRITKLTLVNDVRATELSALGYPFHWPLDEAMEHWLEQGL